MSDTSMSMGCYGGGKGTLPMSEQMIPGKNPGTTKGTLARPGAPKPASKPKFNSKAGGSVRPQLGK